jgi:hypothetical protein
MFMTREAVNQANELAVDFPNRIARGMDLLLLGAAKIIVEGVQSRAPDFAQVKGYAEKLDVALLSGMGNEHGVVIYYKSEPRKLNMDLEGRNTALLFIPNKRSPKWVSVLGRYQPWPPYMVPTMPAKTEARVIVRQITERESQDLRDRIVVNRRRIEMDLSEAGMHNSTIKLDTKRSDSVDVVDDISYAVLRAEYGYGGPSQPHWRPAMKALEAEMDSLQERFVRYMETGSESAFQLPEHETLSSSTFSNYDTRLQDKIVG